MPIRAIIRGGNRFRQHIRRVRSSLQRNPKSIEVGFFASAKYPDGTPVTNVAAWNEFGTRTRGGSVHIPARPFMRQAREPGKEAVRNAVKASMDARTMKVTNAIAGRIGEAHRAAIIRSITNLKEPPNAPETIRRKKGGDNPLINEGILRGSVSYKINR